MNSSFLNELESLSLIFSILSSISSLIYSTYLNYPLMELKYLVTLFSLCFLGINTVVPRTTLGQHRGEGTSLHGVRV